MVQMKPKLKSYNNTLKCVSAKKTAYTGRANARLLAKALHSRRNNLTNLSVLMPMAIAVGMMFVLILNLAILFKTYYKKVSPGEVLILSTLETEPRIIRNGALVFPIIYKGSKVILQAQAVEIDKDIIKKIKEKYDLNIKTISIQVIDTEESILKAHSRIDFSNKDQTRKQLNSILSLAVQEALNTESEYKVFKAKISIALNNIGCELVV